VCIISPFSITITSPGCTSLSNLKPQTSNAQLSELTAKPASFFPIQSGRKPFASRTAINLFLLLAITSEYAPSKNSAALMIPSNALSDFVM
jgi:hypothetical protein